MNPPAIPEVSSNSESVTGNGAAMMIGGGSAMVLTGVLGATVLLTGDVPLWITGVLVLFALLGLIVLARGMGEHVTWHPAEVHFAQVPLTLGSSSEITMVRRAKKQLNDNPHVEAIGAFICEEEVKYTTGSGKNRSTRTVEKQVAMVPVRLVGSIQANTFTGTGQLHVPVTSGAPTLRLDHHKIRWQLRIELGELSKLSRDVKIDCLVVPELDRQHITFTDAPPPPGPQDA